MTKMNWERARMEYLLATRDSDPLATEKAKASPRSPGAVTGRRKKRAASSKLKPTKSSRKLAGRKQQRARAVLLEVDQVWTAGSRLRHLRRLLADASSKGQQELAEQLTMRIRAETGMPVSGGTDTPEVRRTSTRSSSVRPSSASQRSWMIPVVATDPETLKLRKAHIINPARRALALCGQRIDYAVSFRQVQPQTIACKACRAASSRPKRAAKSRSSKVKISGTKRRNRHK